MFVVDTSKSVGFVPVFNTIAVSFPVFEAAKAEFSFSTADVAVVFASVSAVVVAKLCVIVPGFVDASLVLSILVVLFC